MEPVEILVLCILLFIILLLILYIVILKMQMKSFSKKVENLLDDEYEEIIKVDVFDKDIVNLATIMNKHVFRQRKLASDYIADKEALNNLVSGISHDFRTPLTASIGYLQMIEKSGEIKEQKNQEYLRIAIDKNKYLKQLSDDFFDLSKHENGAKRDVVVERIHLASMLEETLLEQFSWISEKNITPEVRIDSNVYIEADKHSIKRIIDNMFSNAQKYAIKKLRVELTKDHLIISNGIADESEIDIDHVFEPFYRGVSRNKEGSGLGLYVVKYLADEYGFDVRAKIENREFTIILDIKKSN